MVRFNILIFYNLLKNYPKKLNQTQRSILKYHQKEGKYNYDLVKDINLFSRNHGFQCNLIRDYYQNRDRNEKAVKEFRKNLLFNFTSQGGDKNVIEKLHDAHTVRVYELLITTNANRYHVKHEYIRHNGHLFVGRNLKIYDEHGLSYQNWSNAIKGFKRNFLRRRRTYLLSGMIHNKPNILSLVQLHSHIILFCYGKIDVTAYSISHYFAKKLGFDVTAKIRPVRNVITKKPVVFDKNNYNEPLHNINVHDRNYGHFTDEYSSNYHHGKEFRSNHHSDDNNVQSSSLNSSTRPNNHKQNHNRERSLQQRPGNDYDSVQDAENVSGSDSNDVSIPDALAESHQNRGQQQHYNNPNPASDSCIDIAGSDDKHGNRTIVPNFQLVGGKHVSDFDVARKMGSKRFVKYIIVAKNSAHGNRRHPLYTHFRFNGRAAIRQQSKKLKKIKVRRSKDILIKIIAVIPGATSIIRKPLLHHEAKLRKQEIRRLIKKNTPKRRALRQRILNNNTGLKVRQFRLIAGSLTLSSLNSFPNNAPAWTIKGNLIQYTNAMDITIRKRKSAHRRKRIQHFIANNLFVNDVRSNQNLYHLCYEIKPNNWTLHRYHQCKKAFIEINREVNRSLNTRVNLSSVYDEILSQFWPATSVLRLTSGLPNVLNHDFLCYEIKPLKLIKDSDNNKGRINKKGLLKISSKPPIIIRIIIKFSKRTSGIPPP